MTGKTIDLIIKIVDLAIDLAVALVEKLKGRKGNDDKGAAKAK